MNTLRRIPLLLVLACWVGAAQGQTTWHVDDDCSPPGTGTEANPFCTIQDGVNASSNGDTVLVAPGTYTGGGNRDISLFGKRITVRSLSGPSATTIDCQGGPGAIHRGFFLVHGETLESVVDGFTITGGYLIGITDGIGDGGGGAAIYIRGSSPTVRSCVLRENTSATLGAPGVVDGRGGGIYIGGDSSTLIEQCEIVDNLAEKRGGAIYAGFFSSAVVVRNCLIAGNSGLEGGGIHNGGGNTTVINATIVNNTAIVGGGIENEQGQPFLSNCILWGNEAVCGQQISLQGEELSIEHCNVQGGLGGVESCFSGTINWGPGMIDADPLFVDPENGDHHLLSGSPCTDAGNNLAVSEGVTTDLDGDPRFLDDPNVPDTGNPDPDAPELPIVDMGPYEFDHQDCNGNDQPDRDDIANGISQDCNANEIPDECEIDCNDTAQPDDCDIAEGISDDCNNNAQPDECEIDAGSPAPGGPFFCNPTVQDCDPDCNDNGQPDSCDIADGSSEDCDGSSVPDECEADCNGNGLADVCDIAAGLSQDCGGEGIPDDCPENPGPVITAQPMSEEVAPGDFVILSVLADGILLEYQWRKDGVELGDTERIFGTNTPGLFIFPVIPEDAGSYDCVVTDFFGDCATSNGAVLTVTAPCPADFDGDEIVNAFDLAQLLGSWGACPDPDACSADLDADGAVGPPDLAILLGHWGPCE